MNTSTTDCCIVGGGPGGMMLGLLLARQGVNVLVLETHPTFEREFRGDTVHPSTIELLDELDLTGRLRALPHIQGNDFPIHTPDGTTSAPAPRRVSAGHPESMAVPQAEFLGLLADVARRHSTFRLEMGARVEHLIEDDDGTIVGARYRAADGWHDVRARLVVGADGRFSKVRQLAGLPLRLLEQGFDLLWLRLPKSNSDPPRAYGLYPRNDVFLVISDRMTVWHVALGIPKGMYQQLKAAGLQAVRDCIAELAPWLADRLSLLEDWNQTSLLNVQAGRVEQWHRPGLLLIGDAAHVMSPVFGVGINYAIQDAVVASNILGPRLLAGDVEQRDLAHVQRRREWPTRLMQWMQAFGEQSSASQPRTLRQRLEGWFLGLGPLMHVRVRLIAFGGWHPERITRPPSSVRGALPSAAASRAEAG